MYDSIPLHSLKKNNATLHTKYSSVQKVAYFSTFNEKTLFKIYSFSHPYLINFPAYNNGIQYRNSHKQYPSYQTRWKKPTRVQIRE